MHAWAFLVLVPFAVARWLAAGPIKDANGISEEMELVFRLGSIVGGMVFACAVAWVAFMIFGRRRGIATLAFIGVYGVMSLAAVGESLAPGTTLPRAAVATPPATRPVPQTQASPGPVEAAVPPATREAFDRATAALRAAQSQTTQPTRDWAATGAFDLTDVKTPQDLDKRLEVLEALFTAHREARLAGDALLAQLRGELSAADAGPVQQELWVAQWAMEVGLDNDQKVALALEEFLAAGRNQLKMLRKEWGNWKLNPQSNRVEFEDPELQEQYARQSHEVSEAEGELKETLGAKPEAANPKPETRNPNQ